MNIEALRMDVEELTAKNGWAGTTVATRLFRVAGELGEVAEEVDGFAEGTLTARSKALSFEVYDLCWNLTSLAKLLGVRLVPPPNKRPTRMLHGRFLDTSAAIGKLFVAVAKADTASNTCPAVAAALVASFQAACAIPGLPLSVLEVHFRNKAAFNMGRTWADSKDSTV